MTRRRRLIAIVLAIFLAFWVIFALVPTTWHGSLNTPTTQATETVAFKCGPLWGASYVRGPSTTAFPVVGTPCGTRDADQVMVAVDILIAIVGIGLVVRLGRGRPGGSYPDALQTPPAVPS